MTVVVDEMVPLDSSTGFELDRNAPERRSGSFFKTGTAFRFIFLVGPSVDCFNALPYVKKWLTRGHRAACDNQSRKSQPLKQECRYDHVRKIFD